jgi:DHA1 family tetracycline resistance protein-like MFS transporter
MKSSFYLILFVAFIDYIGIGLVFPIFSSMLFNPSGALVPVETTAAMRGVWLGLLLTAMPVAQFFSSPLWGTVSDGKGRKKPLAFTLGLAFIGYALAALATHLDSLWGLLISRLFIGCAAVNVSILQAAIADITPKEGKSKNYSLYSMAMGAGFTLGPFFGGWLSTFGYATSFLFVALLVCLNLIFVFFLFKETSPFRIKKKLHLAMGFTLLKKAFQLHGLKTIFLCSFLGCFGWVYFFEFIPVFLIKNFQFSPKDLGLFFMVAGGMYTLSTGLLIRPLLKRFKPELLLFASMLLSGTLIFSLAFIPSAIWVWPLMILIVYSDAPFSPTSTTLVSNGASPEIQGEALGVLGSINAAAFALSPLASGSFVGDHPQMPMWIGGSLLCVSGMIGCAVFRSKLFRFL